MKVLLSPDPEPSRAGGDETPNQSEDLNRLSNSELIKRFLAATATISKMESREKQVAADEKLIKEKMNRGLNRNQAIAVIERQRKFDQATPAPKASV